MELRINLANRPYLNRRVAWRWLLLAALGLLLILVLNLNSGLISYRQLRQIETRMTELDQQLVGLQGAAGRYSPENHAKIRKQVDEINRLIDADQFRWTALLSRFEELLPADVSIASLQPDFKQRALRLDAEAKDVTAMLDFIDRLLAADDFNRTYLLRQAATDGRAGAPALIRFSLEIREAF
ncbi:MAG: hypothetical protein RQ723_04995 [Desulfuromonadales bacterium]|nr:hypothetical protein [Desulfuromonadales bacterium]